MEKGFYFLVAGFVFVAGCFIGAHKQRTEKATIDLPEEYKEINDSTQIKGRYNKDTNTLTIEFNNGN